MKFYRADFHTIGSGLVVRYRIIDSNRDGEISASRDGVLIQGIWPHMALDDIASVKAVLDQAFAHFMVLASGNLFGSRPEAIEFHYEPSCVIEQRKYRFASSDYETIASRKSEGGAS